MFRLSAPVAKKIFPNIVCRCDCPILNRQEQVKLSYPYIVWGFWNSATFCFVFDTCCTISYSCSHISSEYNKNQTRSKNAGMVNAVTICVILIQTHRRRADKLVSNHSLSALLFILEQAHKKWCVGGWIHYARTKMCHSKPVFCLLGWDDCTVAQ